ncbi:MFS transporter [Arthrobacter sp. UM1]|uniref:MFS transporter n=1 Tax=Arthrobacter sp. UM1 TaxID=2766776 RepID=UPI001CF7120C|nr:MFS transporter [Arthrobacter sp. UM1]MCB4208585.1 MFS transporter [Arthrobacter sp. UM1]
MTTALRSFGRAPWLIAAIALSKAGTLAYTTVMLWAVNQYAGAGGVGLVNALGGLTSVLAGISATVWIDRFDRRMILLVLDGITAALTFLAVGVLVLTPWNNVTVIAATIAMVTAAAASLYSPASRSLVPALVPQSSLEQYNSFYTSFTELSRAIGPALGTILLAVGGSDAFALSLLVNGLSFAFSFLFTMNLPRVEGHRVEDRRHDRAFSAYAYLAGQPHLLGDLAGAMGINFALSSLTYVLLGRLAETGSPASMFGLAHSIEAIGVVVSALLAARLGDSLRLMRAPQLLVPVALSLLIGLLAGPWTVTAAITAAAILVTFFNIVLFSRLQREIPREIIGRVVAVVTTSSAALIPLGNLVFAFLASRVTSNTLILITCAGLVALRFIAAHLGRRTLKAGSPSLQNGSAGASTS